MKEKSAVKGDKTMSEKNKWAANVHAIGRLKISGSQASGVEDHNYSAIETPILILGRMI
jgi:hypothetical protein